MGFRLLYRLLLLAYPRTFRTDHADEASRVFVEACRESWRTRGVAGVLARACRALIDVPVRGLSERAAARRTGGRHRKQSTRLWSDVLQDARYGVRSLRRSPAFTFTSLLTMTIGITLCTTMFTAFNAVGLRGWPVENAEHLVLIRPGGSSPLALPGFSLDALERFERSKTLAVAAGSRRAFLSVSLDSEGRTRGGGFGQYVTPGFFEATGVRLAMGRDFRPEENRVNAHEPVVIISHDLWHQLFAEGADVVGRSLYINKSAYAVIGVTRAGWRGEQPYRDNVWLPLHALQQFVPDDSLFLSEGARCCLNVLGLVAPGYSRAQVAEELTMLAQSGQGGQPPQAMVSNTSMFDRTTGTLRAAITLSVVVATGLVLLLTGANIAHLQLARAIARGREIRTRMALGAGRGRVVRQLITEAVLLTTVAGVLAMAVVYALLDTLMRISELPMPDIWTPNLLVYAYCVVVAFAMSMTFSLLPALRSTRVSLSQAAGATATTSRLRFNMVLLTAQIALSTSLLTGAALLTRAFIQATRGDAGFVIDGLTIATYEPSAPAAKSGEGARAFRLALEDALAKSGLPPTAFIDTLPFASVLTAQVKREAGDQQAHSVDLAPMSASAFAVFGIPLVEGRPYSNQETSLEAVVNERASRRIWPGESPIGKTLIHGKRVYTVVGVSRDVHFVSRDTIRPMLHVGTAKAHPGILVRSSEPAAADRLKAVVTGVDREARFTVRTLSETIAARLGDEKAGAQAAWAGGMLALALATFGVFGVFAFVVEERRREIGIRVALGAQRREVIATMFRPARVAVSTGLALGLILSLSVGPSLGGLGIRLYGLSPFDPVTFLIVAVILTSAAVAATFIPARRALGVNPAVILKEDA